MMETIFFNGVDLSSLAIINDIRKSLFAGQTLTTTSLNSIPGSKYRGRKFESNSIEVDFTIIGSEAEMEAKARQLALLFDEEEAQIILSSAPDVFYTGTLEGEADVSDHYYGQHKKGTLRFALSYPYAQSIVEYQTAISSGSTAVAYNATAESYPMIEVTATEDTTAVAFITEEQAFILGQPVDLENETASNLTPQVVRDDCSVLTGWTSTTLPGWTTQGTFIANGYTFRQSASNYGTGTGWHGGQYVKTLSRALNNFEAEFRIEFKASQLKQTGKIELVGLDSSNNEVFCLRLVDAKNSANTNYFVARAGGDTVYNGLGNSDKTWRDFKGILRMTKIGTKFEAYIENQTGGKSHSRLRRTAIKTTNSLAKIVVRIGTYGTAPAANMMAIHDINVKEVSLAGSNVIDKIIKTGDVIRLDNENGQVFVNDTLFNHKIYAGSEFLKLKNGANSIQIEPAFSGTLKYRKTYK